MTSTPFLSLSINLAIMIESRHSKDETFLEYEEDWADVDVLYNF